MMLLLMLLLMMMMMSATDHQRQQLNPQQQQQAIAAGLWLKTQMVGAKGPRGLAGAQHGRTRGAGGEST